MIACFNGGWFLNLSFESGGKIGLPSSVSSSSGNETYPPKRQAWTKISRSPFLVLNKTGPTGIPKPNFVTLTPNNLAAM